MTRLATAGGVAAGGAALGLLLTALPAAADQGYHTQNIAVAPVAGGSGSGTVTNIHANGPVNYGIERYRLRGAAPRTTYEVALTIFEDTACVTPVPGLRFVTAQLTTNGVGNGNDGATFSAAAVAPLVREPAVLNGRWTFSVGGAVAYATSCVQISVDVPPGAPAPAPSPQPSPTVGP